ncbi:hypothetical protein JCM16816_21450 [Thermoanaerobacter brockii subsp. lactiethylicus]
MKDLCTLFNSFHPFEPKYTYFSTRRRKLYVFTLFLLFGIEIAIFILGVIILGGILHSVLSNKIMITIVVFLLILLFVAIHRLENFSNYLKEQDKREIRKNLKRKIKKIKTGKLKNNDVIHFLIMLREENKIVKETLENSKEPTLTMNLVNTSLGGIVGYYLADIKSYEEARISPLIFLLIIFAILYSYFILDINKASRLYLIELYNYQISYANRLIKRYWK